VTIGDGAAGAGVVVKDGITIKSPRKARSPI
jgi:hypothetical protein